MKELLQHLKTYLQLHHDQNDGGVHINLIARINEELEKPDTDLDYWHVVQEINKFIDRSNIGFCKAEALLEKVDAELAKPEPVARLAWFRKYERDTAELVISDASQGDSFPVYTHPPAQQKPLSDAAPDMYSALERFIACVDKQNFDYESGLIRQAKAALAKARGENEN